MLLLSLVSNAQTEAPGSFHQDLSWSPDGTRLVFSAMQSGKTDLYTIRVDGSGLTRLTQDAGNNVWASFSPDGERIAFHSDRSGGGGDVWVMNADGSNPVRLTSYASRNAYPSWSPDGKRIVFASTRAGGQQLFVMKADGSDQVRITSATVDGTKYYNPVWSPKSNRIVFYSSKGDHNDQILVINADGSSQRVLTGGIGHNTFPSWTPDGKRIIFNSDREGVRRALYLIDADGSDLERFGAKPASSGKAQGEKTPEAETVGSKPETVDSLNTFFVRLSPDGKRLAYIVGGYPRTQIYVMNADGSGATMLTK